MSDITKASVLVNGHQETEDFSSNTLDVGNLKVAGTLISQATVAASYAGTVSGTATPVTVTANNGGAVGNAIVLAFTGSNTITSAIATWNGAHPSNLATLLSGDGSQTPSLQNLGLSGGLDPGSTLIGNAATYANFTPTSPTVAGALAGIDAALATVASSEKVYPYVLNSTDESNKFIVLPSTPAIPGNTILMVENAPSMFYGVDFTVSGNQLGWSGLALDGILGNLDKITVTYSI
jgi:hypothetical protein